MSNINEMPQMTFHQIIIEWLSVLFIIAGIAGLIFTTMNICSYPKKDMSELEEALTDIAIHSANSTH